MDPVNKDVIQSQNQIHSKALTVVSFGFVFF